jgi:hypothetical protein
MGALAIDAATADRILSVVWLPVLPIGTFLLARRATGRPWVALLAVAITLFAGAYDLNPRRTWVNSLFMSGHAFYPLYPRDVVFGILPFAVVAFLNAISTTSSTRALRWGLVAGLLLGIAGLVQVQLLLPLPVALAATVGAIAWRDPGRRRPALAALAASGLVAALLVAPWFIGQVEAIRRNGGVALDSAETLEPALIGFWGYARQFGLILPAALVGAGVGLLFLRRSDGPRPDRVIPGPWLPRPAEAGLVLAVWAIVPFVLAILYRPDWPLEDALRPQRLWLIASQPMAILAAIGLAAAAEHRFGPLRWPGPVPVSVGLAVVLMAIPTTVATASLVGATWTTPAYAHLDLSRDRVPDFGALLGRTGPRRTLLTYEDWSSVAWYETGLWVVGHKPAGYAKLAYDPLRFTGHGQDERREAVARAFAGDAAAFATVADRYRARLAVLARQDERLGWLDQVATVAARMPGGLVGSATIVEGNGWDAIALEPGSRLRLQPGTVGPVRLDIRVFGSRSGGPAAVGRMRLLAEGAGTERPLATLASPSTIEPWVVVSADVVIRPDDRIVIEAVEAVTIQSVRGYLDAPVPGGWRMRTETPDAAVLERVD